ncbi:DNA polymerase III subunit epsilon [Rhodoblastus acidophilus]|uniref:DNA polymerase III subunit epsilon n=1 Tax=Candidatus Rhodoblastus alkanivorans TaxID=2954117 RepID=A0ABS9Z288_9HYPH|nr:DNA polymerase III subunit epsilon [Candidatus Rhodoblastus alkanivorans]MCI4678104.1 DNA polymerase III subunit epsilon [Candidatus Rhodoblastus alkanivorans]MCI4681555.1 DNA polymerase III subunit epsilon [Candidatus Rhodoblastus alkanivorans]MDI4642603.1 DNA polymerase III subunit epsilon [Rhodoblastus acidophilus]
MEREIVIDTETTGLEANAGDRIIEIAAIELLNGIPSQNIFHTYVNPERDIPDSAFKVHGISYEMVADKPKFCDIVDQFLEFIVGDPIVAHNAEFDLGFINAELRRVGRAALNGNPVVDTLAMARKKFPAQSNSLDALCNRFGIDRSRRVKHGALVDAEILAEVYTELRGGRQTTLTLQVRREISKGAANFSLLRQRPRDLPLALADAESAAHALLVQELGAPALWARYTEVSESK